MSEKVKAEYSAQEQQLLEYAAFVGEILERLLPKNNIDSKQKPWWQVFLESTGGAALITVLVGGVIAGAVGQWITNEYQRSMKERETSVAAYKDYLGQGKETVTQANELIGNTISATDDFMDIADLPYYQGNYNFSDLAERKRVEDERDEVWNKFKSARLNWRKESERLGLFISYSHDAQPEVMTSWRQMQDSVAAYISCAQSYLLVRAVSPRRDVGAQDRCEGPKSRVHDSLDKFTTARLKVAQQQARTGWSVFGQ